MRGGAVLEAVAAVALAAAAAALAGCGGASCGNGSKESGEQCDDGNDVNDDFCTNECINHLPDTIDLTLRWDFNKDLDLGFDGDSCLDMGVVSMLATLSGGGLAAPIEHTEQCGIRQSVFPDLQPGTYLGAIRPLDIDDMPLTSAPVEATLQIGSTDVQHEIVIPWDAWSGDFTGAFFFRVSWAGQDCAAAAPPVVQERLTLSRDGNPLAAVTDDGVPLDGSAPGDCQSTALEFPQRAAMVPWGPATFTVVGLDGDGGEAFRQEIDTFVGAGISNPELLFDVASTAPDAGPDAGPADAGAPDAGPGGV